MNESPENPVPPEISPIPETIPSPIETSMTQPAPAVPIQQPAVMPTTAVVKTNKLASIPVWVWIVAVVLLVAAGVGISFAVGSSKITKKTDSPAVTDPSKDSTQPTSSSDYVSNTIADWQKLDASKSNSLDKNLFVYTKEPTNFYQDFPDSDKSFVQARMLVKQMASWTIDLNGVGKSSAFFDGLNFIQPSIGLYDSHITLDSTDTSAQVFFGTDSLDDMISLNEYSTYPAVIRSVWVAKDKGTYFNTSRGTSSDVQADPNAQSGGPSLAAAKGFAQQILDKYVVSDYSDYVSNYAKYTGRQDDIQKGYRKADDSIQFIPDVDGGSYYIWENYSSEKSDYKTNLKLVVGVNKDNSIYGWQIATTPSLLK